MSEERLFVPRGHRLAAVVAAVVLAGALHAQSAVFEETTRVLEVQVPVQVFDRTGRPIRGLSAEDFQILDRKTPRRVSRFEMIDLEVLTSGSSDIEIERAIQAAGRRHFLLLFDLSFSQPASLLRARLAARDLVLDHLHPTDLVAVATHSVDRGARILVTFTTDRAQVARAIDTLGAPNLLSLTRRDPLNFLIDEPGSASGKLAVGARTASEASGAQLLQTEANLTYWVLGQEMNHAERQRSIGQVSAWARSLSELARLLGSAQGRKQVLYFSEGWDGDLLFGREAGFSETDLRDQQNLEALNRHWSVHGADRLVNTGLQNEVDRMLEVFRRADCVLQTIDIADLSADGAGSARRSRLHALFYIASEVGGELFEGSGRLGERLAEVLERSSVTYLLTFSADDVPSDGSYRELKVRVQLPRGGRVSARPGYYAPRPFEELHPFEKGLLASQAIAAGAPVPEIPIGLLAAPFRTGEASAYVPVIIEVAGAALVAGQSGPKLSAEIFAYVTDERGEMRDFFAQLVSLDFAQSESGRFPGSGVKYYGHMSLVAGDYLLRVMVRNAETGRYGLATLPLAVPDYTLARPFLLPPFFVESGGDWVLLRERRDAGYQRTVVYPFTVGGEPYVPSASPELRRGEATKVCLVVYNLGEGEFEIEGTVLGEEGIPVEGGSLGPVERTLTGLTGIDKLLATFETRGLRAGSYELQIALTDRGSGSTELSSIPFRVRD